MAFKLRSLLVMIILASCATHRGCSYVYSKSRFYNWGYGHYNLRDHWSNGTIPGLAGKNYPIFHRVPWTRFLCDWRYPGYYADPETDCQAYHICQRDGRKDSFLCPNGTLFNQERLVCTWWYTVDCSRAQSFYSINEAVAKAMEEADRRIGVTAAQKFWSSNWYKSWNKNWQNQRQGWNKDSIPICHN